MKNFLILINFLTIQLQTCLSWDVKYVAEKLVIPIAMATQELTFCICHDCLGEPDLDLLMKWLQITTIHP